MSEADTTSSGGYPGMEEALQEAHRFEALSSLRIKAELTDAQLVLLLSCARQHVDGIRIHANSMQVQAIYEDPEYGEMTSVLSRRSVLILAQLYHAVRKVIEEQWKVEHSEGPDLFHRTELPDAGIVHGLMPNDISASTSIRVHEIIKHALELEAEGALSDLEHPLEPNPDAIQGHLMIDTEAVNAPDKVIAGVTRRLIRIFNATPVRIARSMPEWKNWTHLIQPASERDVPEMHNLYGSVLIPKTKLLQLDPRFARPDEFSLASGDVRNHGAMFKALRTNGSDDELLEGLTAGRIAMIREEPQQDAPGQPGELVGFYNVVSDPNTVRAHMRSELMFSSNASYRSSADLPRFSRFETPTGEVKTISYSDESGAVRVFDAASQGTLAWSVDHAVRMDGPERLRRYAQAGTALKIDQYEAMRQSGKHSVLLKIATVIGVDASLAAQECRVEPVDVSAWETDGPCPWNVDQSGMVVIHRPIVNVGSTTLNTRLGAHEVFTVTEEFMRDGIKLRILWRYYLQPLPANRP